MGGHLGKDIQDFSRFDVCRKEDFEMAVDESGTPMVLGQGGFGKAELVRYKRTMHLFVRKTIKAETMDERMLIANEIGNMPDVHPHLVQKYGIYDDYAYLELAKAHVACKVIIMEFCPGKDLHGMLKKIYNGRKAPITNSDAMSFFFQLCQGLKYLHDNNIVHRDVKPDNIFFTADKKLKLGDFGLSYRLAHHGAYLADKAGTPYYLAPEEWRPQLYYSFPVDVFAAGLTLLATLVVRPSAAPNEKWNAPMSVMEFLGDTVRPPGYLFGVQSHLCMDRIANASFPEETKSLLYGLLNRNPEKRLTVNAVLSMQWAGGAMKEGADLTMTVITPARHILVPETPQETATRALERTKEICDKLNVPCTKYLTNTSSYLMVQIHCPPLVCDVKVSCDTENYVARATSAYTVPYGREGDVDYYISKANAEMAPVEPLARDRTRGGVVFSAAFLLDSSSDDADVIRDIEMIFDFMQANAGKHLQAIANLIDAPASVGIPASTSSPHLGNRAETGGKPIMHSPRVPGRGEQFQTGGAGASIPSSNSSPSIPEATPVRRGSGSVAAQHLAPLPTTGLGLDRVMPGASPARRMTPNLDSAKPKDSPFNTPGIERAFVDEPRQKMMETALADKAWTYQWVGPELKIDDNNPGHRLLGAVANGRISWRGRARSSVAPSVVNSYMAEVNKIMGSSVVRDDAGVSLIRITLPPGRQSEGNVAAALTLFLKMFEAYEQGLAELAVNGASKAAEAFKSRFSDGEIATIAMLQS